MFTCKQSSSSCFTGFLVPVDQWNTVKPLAGLCAPGLTTQRPTHFFYCFYCSNINFMHCIIGKCCPSTVYSSFFIVCLLTVLNAWFSCSPVWAHYIHTTTYLQMYRIRKQYEFGTQQTCYKKCFQLYLLYFLFILLLKGTVYPDSRAGSSKRSSSQRWILWELAAPPKIRSPQHFIKQLTVDGPCLYSNLSKRLEMEQTLLVSSRWS